MASTLVVIQGDTVVGRFTKVLPCWNFMRDRHTLSSPVVCFDGEQNFKYRIGGYINFHDWVNRYGSGR